VQIPAVDRNCLPVWHLYVIQVDDRNTVQRELHDRGIATAMHYPIPCHMQEAYKHLNYAQGSLPVTEAYSQRLLSLPMFPELTADQIHFVCENLIKAVNGELSEKVVAAG
jgi:dTDP-4-amino-4,6-dideoxygalactose transaminase